MTQSTFNVKINCDACTGTGEALGGPCPVCKGVGMVQRDTEGWTQETYEAALETLSKDLDKDFEMIFGGQSTTHSISRFITLRKK